MPMRAVLSLALAESVGGDRFVLGSESAVLASATSTAATQLLVVGVALSEEDPEVGPSCKGGLIVSTTSANFFSWLCTVGAMSWIRD